MQKLKKARYSKMFPEVDIQRNTKTSLHMKGKGTSPFNIETGKFLVGKYEGKSFDEIFKIDPGFIFREVYYWSSVWTVDHQAAFILWTKTLK